MYKFTPSQVIELRTDPTLFDQNNYASEFPPRIIPLTTLLLFSKELFGDIAIEELPRPTCPGVDYIEDLTARLEFILGLEDSVSLDMINSLEKSRKAEHNLPADFVPSEELLNYQKFLRLKDKKTIVSRSEIERVEKRLRHFNRLPRDKSNWGDEATDPLGLTGATIYKTRDASIYVNVRLERQIRIKTFTQLHLAFDVDFMVISPMGATITNIVSIDNIKDFPAMYKEKRLDIVASFQQYLVAQALHNSTPVTVNFAVLDDNSSHIFTVGNYLNMNEELEKCVHHLTTGDFRLPFEFLDNNYRL